MRFRNLYLLPIAPITYKSIFVLFFLSLALFAYGQPDSISNPSLLIEDSAPIIREYEIPLAKYNQILQRAGRSAINQRSSLVTPSGTVVLTYELPAPKKRKKKKIPVSVPANSFYHLMPKSLDEVELAANGSSTNTFINGLDTDTDAANNGFITFPPDPSGAVGTTHVCYTVNRSIDCYTKAGIQVAGFSTSLQNFFNPLSPENATFDPKIIWDQYENRFVAVTLIQTENPNTSSVLLAVSATADPTGSWYFQSINTIQNVNGSDCWFDYPGLAIDEEAIYITGNYFDFPNFSYCNSNVIIIDKGVSGGIYAGVTSTDDNPTTNSAFNIYNPVNEAGAGVNSLMMPAHVFGTTPGDFGTYLISYSGDSDGTQELFQTFKIDRPLNSPTFTQQDVLIGDIDNTSAFLPDAAQPSYFDLQTNDRRSLSAIWRNDGLWMTTTVNPPNGVNTGQATAYWAKLNADGVNALTFSIGGEVGGENVTLGAATFFPTLAVNAAGDAAMVYSASSNDLFAGAYAVKIDGSTGSQVEYDVLKAGTSAYSTGNGTFSQPFRWGDYSSMAVDPVTDLFWGTHQAAVNGGIWQVFVKEFTKGCFGNPEFCDDDGDLIPNISDNCPNVPTTSTSIGLNFDGIDDNVRLPYHPATNFASDEDFTIEFWAKTPSTPQPNTQEVDVSILESWGSNVGEAGYSYALRYFKNTGKITAIRYDGANAPNMVSTTAVNDDQWHHIAFVKDGSTLRLYIDGEEEGNTFDSTTGGVLGNNPDVTIGSRANTLNWKGSMDELRFWNVPRTPTEINDNMNQELTGTESGLVGYYPFNEGIPGENNNAITTVFDQTINNNDGTLQNFVERGLLFDGIDDKIDVPYHPATHFASDEDFTIELWAKTPSTAQPNTQEVDVSLLESWGTNVGEAGYSYTIRYFKNTNKITVARYDGANGPNIQSTTSVNDDQWHHIAFVKDGSTLRLYIDGQEEGNTFDSTTGGTLGNNPDLTIGSRVNILNWKGSMDELRFWNVTRTPAQINANMNQRISGTESGIVAYYPLYDGISNDPNTMTSIMEDKSVNANNGAAKNFTDTPISNHWTSGAPMNELDGDFDGSGDSCDLCLGDDTTGDDDNDSVCNDFDPDATGICDSGSAGIGPLDYGVHGNPYNIFRVSQSIETNSNVIVPANVTVHYVAGESIILKPGFHAQPQSTFTARIKACTNPAVISVESRSEEETFTTPPQDLTLTVFPNPTNGLTNIQYELPQAEVVTIVIYNLQGKIIRTLQQGVKQQAGIHEAVWNAYDVANGVYLIRIQTATAAKVERVIVAEAR